MYEITVTKMIQKDNYRNGCDPDSIRDMGVVNTHKVQSLDEVATILKDYAPGEPSIYEDRLEIPVQENDEGLEPTDAEKAAFEKGEIDLWVADYSFTIEKVERTPLGNQDLVKYFPHLEQQ